MKIEGILQINDYFCVDLKYSWLEKLFCFKNKTVKYKAIGRTFEGTHEPIYVDKDGNKLGPYSRIGEEINRFKRKKIFHEEELHLNMN